MPIVQVTRGDAVNGYRNASLAQDRAVDVQVKWQSLTATCGAGLGNKRRFVESAGFWAHVAFILADPANLTDVLWGPNQNAASRILSPGTEYEIPPVYPMIQNSWAVFDLGDWWFCCAANVATITVIYV
jgi:hypothetical protein